MYFKTFWSFVRLYISSCYCYLNLAVVGQYRLFLSNVLKQKQDFLKKHQLQSAAIFFWVFGKNKVPFVVKRTEET